MKDLTLTYLFHIDVNLMFILAYLKFNVYDILLVYNKDVKH